MLLLSFSNFLCLSVFSLPSFVPPDWLSSALFSLSQTHIHIPAEPDVNSYMCWENVQLSCSILLWLSILMERGDVEIDPKQWLRRCTRVWGWFSLLCGHIMIERKFFLVIPFSLNSQGLVIPFCRVPVYMCIIFLCLWLVLTDKFNSYNLQWSINTELMLSRLLFLVSDSFLMIKYVHRRHK